MIVYLYMYVLPVLQCHSSFRTVVVGVLGYIALSLLCCTAAVTMFSNYLTLGCDPLASGEIYSPNQARFPQFSMTETLLLSKCKQRFFFITASTAFCRVGFERSWLDGSVCGGDRVFNDEV